jgi:hypothetical protein
MLNDNDWMMRVAWTVAAVLGMGGAFTLGTVYKSTDTTPCVQAIESAQAAFAAQAEFTRATGDFVGSLAPALQAAWDRDTRGLERARDDIATFRDAATRMSEAVAANEFDQYAAECVTES